MKMNLGRRQFMTGLAASLWVASPAMAQNAATDSVVQQLERQGYTVVEIRRTLLGRVRVLARFGDLVREVVFDPRNGAILRDYTSGGEGPSIAGSRGGSGNGSGSDDDDVSLGDKYFSTPETGDLIDQNENSI
ncbi:MAG: hypothetical protein JKY00_02885, partial [Roseicyclus sp.]|nr:hypothetical protein [Roseicyclus sp.]